MGNIIFSRKVASSLKHSYAVANFDKEIEMNSLPVYDILCIKKCLQAILTDTEPISENELYEKGINELEKAESSEEFARAYDIFHLIGTYKDAENLKEKAKIGFDEKLKNDKINWIIELEKSKKKKKKSSYNVNVVLLFMFLFGTPFGWLLIICIILAFCSM